MPKTTTPAMEAHIAEEVTTLCHCFYIEQENGRVIRMTDHDSDLSVDGEQFFSTLGFNLSAIETTAGMNTDNASVTIGLDETVYKRVDFEEGRFRNALFGIFTVNWQDPDGGKIWLKKGFIGTATIEKEKAEVTLELLGMTAATNGKSIEQFSPTCRANLGDRRCGYCNLPNKVRVNKLQQTTGNFLVRPQAMSDLLLSNPSWESDGEVPVGETGISDWQRTPSSEWAVGSSFTSVDGAYYLIKKTSTYRARMWQDANTSAVGIQSSDVNNGIVGVTASCSISTYATDETEIGRASIMIEALDANGTTLLGAESKVIGKEQNLSEGKWVVTAATILLPPGTKTLRFIVFAYGNSKVMFDNYKAYSWLHANTAALGDHCTKSTKVFNNSLINSVAGSIELDNSTFSLDGAVSNTEDAVTSWSAPAGSYWRTATSIGALTPVYGQYMLVGGDNGSGNQSIYETTQSKSMTFLNAQQSDIENNWWYYEAVVRFSNVEDHQSEFRVTLELLDSSNVVVETIQTAWSKSVLVNQWDKVPLRLGGKLHVGTSSINLRMEVRSAIGSSAGNIAIDNAEVYCYPVAYEGDHDPDWGTLAASDVASSTTVGDFTTDGEIMLQTQALTFGYGSVAAELDNLSFVTYDVTYTSKEMYGGVIYWLTGANAGITTHCRVFDNVGGSVHLYEALASTPQVGDKFIFSMGCDKTIDTCADRFNNAINFRGEPYLPGTDSIITFLQQG